MEIEQDQKGGKVSLTRRGYLKKVLQKFNINGDAKSVCTPLAPHFKLKATMPLTSNEEREYMPNVPYASAFGSLMHTMVCTRPDMSVVVSMVKRYMHDPDRGHWKTVK